MMKVLKQAFLVIIAAVSLTACFKPIYWDQPRDYYECRPGEACWKTMSPQKQAQYRQEWLRQRQAMRREDNHMDQRTFRTVRPASTY